MHRQHEDREVRIPRFDVLNQFDAIAAFERNIDDRYVRLQRADRFKGFGRILGLAADDHVSLLVDQLGQAAAQDRVIIHQQHFGFRFAESELIFINHKTSVRIALLHYYFRPNSAFLKWLCTVHVTTVPPSSPARMSKEPPIFWAR